MKAKEYLKSTPLGFIYRINKDRGFKYEFEIEDVYNLMESYQQAKSKEVAERVFNKFNDDFIEEEGKEGGLRDNELQMFWEGGISIRNKIKAAFGKEGEG